MSRLTTDLFSLRTAQRAKMALPANHCPSAIRGQRPADVRDYLKREKKERKKEKEILSGGEDNNGKTRSLSHAARDSIGRSWTSRAHRLVIGKLVHCEFAGADWQALDRGTGPACLPFDLSPKEARKHHPYNLFSRDDAPAAPRTNLPAGRITHEHEPDGTQQPELFSPIMLTQRVGVAAMRRGKYSLFLSSRGGRAFVACMTDG